MGARLLAARAWATFALAAFAAALINPYGIDAFLLPFRLMSVENLSRISEWRPQDFSHIGTMELALLTLLGLTLTRPFAMPPIRAALIIALVAMALQHSRHQVLLGILAPMLLARPIAAAIGMGRAGEEGRRVARIALTAARRGGAGDRRRAAYDADRADRRSRRADLGLKRGPAGVEGKARAERLCIRRLSHLRACAAVHRRARGALRRRDDEPVRETPGRRRAAVESTLKRYDVAWTIFAPDSRIVAILDHEPGWRRLYADATAVVHVRDAAPEAGNGSERGLTRRQTRSARESFRRLQGRAPRATSSFSRSTPGLKWIAGMPSASEARTLAGESSMNRSSLGRRPARLNRIS